MPKNKKIFKVFGGEVNFTEDNIEIPSLIDVAVIGKGREAIEFSGSHKLSTHKVIVDDAQEFQKEVYNFAVDEGTKHSERAKLTWRESVNGTVWPHRTGNSSRSLRSGESRLIRAFRGSIARTSFFSPRGKMNEYITEIERTGREQSRARGDAGGFLPPTRILRNHAEEYLDDSRGNIKRLADKWANSLSKELTSRGIR